jgi:hypothetical protein
MVAGFLAGSMLSNAQSLGSSGTVEVTVTDPTGAVVPGASVEIKNPVSGFVQSQATNQNGFAIFRDVPFNPYHMSVSAKGFTTQAKDVEVRSMVPVILTVPLAVSASQTLTVEGGAADLIETTSVAHTDIDNSLIEKLPVESVSAGLSSAITQASPGVAADSNGFFHPLGEHADTSFSIDNQPISDQQSRVFSNQISLDTVESMEVISGAPPAEYGDKTSLIARVTTKSGLGKTQPTGSIAAGYGSFGTPTVDANLAVGNGTVGTFLAISGINSGRFLDSPEFRPLHDHGNSENIFDRSDYQLDADNSFHLDLTAARSWFQTPNDYDQELAGQDQREEIRSFNVAPGYTHLFSPALLLSTNAYVRQDRIGYFPSADPFSDLPATLGETRRLTNAGIRSELSYSKGIHNFKAGVQFYHTFLSENFRIGLTDPGFNPVCFTAGGAAVAGTAFTDPAECAAAGLVTNTGFQP